MNRRAEIIVEPSLFGRLAKRGLWEIDACLSLRACRRRGTRGTLFWAANQGDADLFYRLLELGADVNARGPAGATALVYAAHNGDVETLGVLLAHGANVNVQDDKGRTALHYATSGEIARLLMENAADVDVKDNDGIRALQATERTQNKKKLLQAVRQGTTEEIKRSLKAGASIETTDEGGKTTLLLAAEAGQAEAMRVLMDAGADPVLCLLFIHPSAHGSEVSPAARNTLDSARIPRASKLLICGLFQKGRVLAQEGCSASIGVRVLMRYRLETRKPSDMSVTLPWCTTLIEAESSALGPDVPSHPMHHASEWRYRCAVMDVENRTILAQLWGEAANRAHTGRIAEAAREPQNRWNVVSTLLALAGRARFCVPLSFARPSLMLPSLPIDAGSRLLRPGPDA